jgi:hypothetical protein
MATASPISLSGGVALFAASDQFHQQSFWWWQIPRPPDYFRVMITDQPPAQLALGL